jgi:hypothetical protein
MLQGGANSDHQKGPNQVDETSMSAFIESAIRFDFASALSTLTFTICPGLTASEGSLMKRLESSLMCTSAMT